MYVSYSSKKYLCTLQGIFIYNFVLAVSFWIIPVFDLPDKITFLSKVYLK